MASSLLLQFKNHGRKLDLIGRIILAYGELEIGLMDLLKATLNGDTKTAVSTLYRLKSESNRLEIADALVTPRLAEHKLDGAWNEAYAAMKCCKDIRNVYAHGQWLDDKGHLRVGDLEIPAIHKGPECSIKLRAVTTFELKEQLAYFQYAHHQMAWISDKYRLTTGQPRLIEQKIPKPKKVHPPKFGSQKGAPTPQ